jgi:hypothetical protein
MSTRVESDAVKEIIETSLTDPEIDAFITAANLTVTKLLADEDLSDDQLREIERWLAAHFIASTRERQVAQETAGQADTTYVGKSGMGLDATFYGQQAKILDTSGTLASLSDKIGLKDATMYAVTSFE